MFAIAKTDPKEGLSPIQTSRPEAPSSHGVQIKIHYAGLCGTDMHIYNWDAWAQKHVKPPRVLGHEFVGEVVAVGSAVTRVETGQMVSGECHVVCGRCSLCKAGKAHLCEQTEIVGVHRDGAFAEVFNFPESNVWPVHSSIPTKHAAIFDPLGNAMHTVDAAQVNGKDTLIVGAGTIGLAAVSMAKAHGARRVFVFEPNPEKRTLALKFGADEAVDSAEGSKWNALKGVEIGSVLEMSGHSAGMSDAFEAVQAGGTVAMLGLPSGEVSFDFAKHIIMKGVSVHGVIGRKMYETWQQVDKFQRSHAGTVEKLITHTVNAESFEDAFALMKAGKSIKTVLDFSQF
ncbi:MAG: L-threonine 3-dehydrogenase [Alphaproteobacteria bacterium]|nr:L-threonine 3-dehydrogenase [Alphaproteobacteria bacterium]